MFVNRIPFLVTTSRHIKFGTVEMLKHVNNTTITKAIEQADGYFEFTRGKVADMGITLNTALPKEHVPEVERHIRTIKEKSRSVINVLPF